MMETYYAFCDVCRAMTVHTRVDVLIAPEDTSTWRFCKLNRDLAGRNAVLFALVADASGADKLLSISDALRNDAGAGHVSICALTIGAGLAAQLSAHGIAVAVPSSVPWQAELRELWGRVWTAGTACIAEEQITAMRTRGKHKPLLGGFNDGGMYVKRWRRGTIHPDVRELVLSSEELKQKVAELAEAAAQTAALEAEPAAAPLVVVGILLGCFAFFADFARALCARLEALGHPPPQFALLEANYAKVSTQDGGSTHSLDLDKGGQVCLSPPTALDQLAGRRLLLVDEALSTGGAMAALLAYLERHAAPASMSAAVLLRNNLRDDGVLPPPLEALRTAGRLSIGHEHRPGVRRTVGYGDDYNGLYRSLDYVGYLDDVIAKKNYKFTRSSTVRTLLRGHDGARR